MKKVEFFFDLSSPYSYLAATQMKPIAERTGAEIVWRPMVLGAVFKAMGNEMPARVPHKARWMGNDLQRWAGAVRRAVALSSHFPLNTIKAMRLVLVDDGKAATVALAAFRRDVGRRSRHHRGGRAAAHRRARRARSGDGAGGDRERRPIKDRLRANTDEAIARGAFGAPTMFVGDELFWGNDRLHFVEAALRREIGAPQQVAPEEAGRRARQPTRNGP